MFKPTRYIAIYKLLQRKLDDWEINHPNEYPVVNIRISAIRKDKFTKREAHDEAKLFGDRMQSIEVINKVTIVGPDIDGLHKPQTKQQVIEHKEKN